MLQFDSDPGSIREPITPDSGSDFGDRLILAPLEVDPTITPDEAKAFISDLAESVNVLTIVPSYARAQQWTGLTPWVITSQNIDDIVAGMKTGLKGLVLAANRYDGIDLPGGACRVVVIDGLPQATTPIEKWFDSILAGSRLRKIRQVQRLEQGMGRAVRSSSDYCVVLLVGVHESQWINDTNTLQLFSPTTRAQLELSRQVAEQVSGQGLEGVKEAVGYCLAVDEEWRQASRSVLSQVRYDSLGDVPQDAVLFRKAFNAAELEDWQQATARVQDAVNAVPDAREKSWYKLWLAHYSHPIGAADAQEILKSARESNPALPKPLDGITYQKVGSGLRSQGLMLSELIANKYPAGAEIAIGVKRILDDLIWDSEGTNAFEEAFKDLGRHLGFEVQRPDRSTGNGPDVLWGVGDSQYWLFECKSGSQSETIAKRDINQLTGHLNWFRSHYDQTCTAIPVMVHPARDLGSEPPVAMRIIDGDHLARLKSAAERFAAELAQPENYRTPNDLYRCLTSHALDRDRLLERFMMEVG